MRRILIALTAATLLAGCGTNSTPELLPPPPVPSAQPSAPSAQPSASSPGTGEPTTVVKSGTTRKPTARPTTKPPTKRAAVIPDDLVGAWETITERGNAFSYELYADGKYIYNGIMEVDGLRYTLSEGGRASISGSRITFRPQFAEMVRSENGTETTTRPTREARQLTFTQSGNRLTMTDPDGVGATYQRA